MMRNRAERRRQVAAARLPGGNSSSSSSSTRKIDRRPPSASFSVARANLKNPRRPMPRQDGTIFRIDCYLVGGGHSRRDGGPPTPWRLWTVGIFTSKTLEFVSAKEAGTLELRETLSKLPCVEQSRLRDRHSPCECCSLGADWLSKAPRKSQPFRIRDVPAPSLTTGRSTNSVTTQAAGQWINTAQNMSRLTLGRGTEWETILNTNECIIR